MPEQLASDDPRIRVSPLRRDILILAAVCGLAFFWRLGSNGLFDLDEALYANAAREMVLRGDYVTPQINGVFFFEKPPLIYWLAAVSFHLFGTTELAARMPSAIASAVLAGLIYWFGKRYLDRRSGLLSAAIFALSPLVMGAARQMTTDAILDLCIAGGLFSFFRAYTSVDTTDKRWYYGFWIAGGLGILDKGIAGSLPIIVAVVFVLFDTGFERNRAMRAFGETRPLIGLAIVLLIAAPWHFLAWRANGDGFIQEYVMKQHVQRFRGGDEAHRLPFWFYIPAFLAGFFPWSLFALPAFTDKGPFGAEEHAERLRRFLVGWALTVFVLFSIAGSKLVSYILPMYAPAALMVGSWLDRASTDIARRRSMSISISVAAILTLIPLLVITLQQQVIRFVESVAHQPARIKSIPAEFVPLVLHLADAAAAGICIALVLVMIKRVRWAIVSLVGGMMLFAVIAISDTIPAIDRFFSAPLQQAAREAGRLAGRKGHIAILLGPPRRPSVLFYLPGDMIAAAGRVTETTSDGLKTYLVANSTAVILTEERRLPEIETAVRTSPAARFGRWVVLRSE